VVGAAVNLPDLTKWNAGDQHDEDMFNAVSYALNFLLSPPECCVSQTSAQSIPNGVVTATPITFDTLVKDNDGMWASGHPTYITIQTPGWYEIEWAVSWASKQSGDTTIRLQSLYLNGAYGIDSSYAYNDFVNDASITPSVWLTYDLFLNPGYQLSLGVMQGTGASLSTASSPTAKDKQTFLRVRWASL
jgi:hypothetical protein